MTASQYVNTIYIILNKEINFSEVFIQLSLPLLLYDYSLRAYIDIDTMTMIFLFILDKLGVANSFMDCIFAHSFT